MFLIAPRTEPGIRHRVAVRSRLVRERNARRRATRYTEAHPPLPAAG